MLDVNIAVLGAPGVGKSTFIQRAVGLRTPPLSDLTARKMALDGVVYNVRLLEVAFEDVTVEDGHTVVWPDYIDDIAMPRIDGAFAFYDVMTPESLGPVPEILNAIVKSAIPCQLVATKCDIHPSHRQIDPSVVEQRAKAVIGDVRVSQLSAANPASYKGTFSALLRTIISLREDHPMYAASRRRANSSALCHLSHPSDPPQVYKHVRANSEFSAAILRAQAPYGSDSQSRMTPRTKSHQHLPSDSQTFLNLEEEPHEDEAAEVEPAMPAPAPTPLNPIITDASTSENGYSFDNLADRLLAEPISKTDSYFPSVFLALYRHFAAPVQLLDAIIIRFLELEENRDATLIRTLSQLRYLAILQQWTSRYPEDFSYSLTRKKACDFANKVANNRIFTVAAKEIQQDLDIEVEDDDAEWAICDTQLRPETSQTFLNTSTVIADAQDDIALSVDSLTLCSNLSTISTRTPSSSTGQSSHSQLNLVEYAAHHARQLVPNPKVPFTKIQWHSLMEQPEDAIAKELTRIDWTMFSSIRPRDLIRHVSLSSEQKKKCKSLENVNRMIDHFNHLAFWAANFILLRAKPKHRALMLEKFMRIARKLRELNNYNSLVAILSGIHSASVHRLAQTRDLISPAVHKDFLKLEILMGTQRSHGAYRLAWENTSGERIPYLPLHLRDLVSAAQGNKTFVGPMNTDGQQKVNWKKFEIMGEVVMGVQKAQGMPYPNFGKNDEVKSLVLETKIVKDDDELYERSVQLEPSANERKGSKFGWFQRTATMSSFSSISGQ